LSRKAHHIEGVLFDLFGTLFVYGDMKRAWQDWIDDIRQGLVRIGLHLTNADVSKACDGFFSGSLIPNLGLTVYETRIQRLAVSLGGVPSNSWCQLLATQSMLRWQAQITLDPEAAPTLRQLRENGIRVGVLSNFDHEPHVLHILRQAGLTDLLDCIMVSGAVGLKKPDPAIFQLALTKLGTIASQTIFLGDHPEQDFAGAHAAGLQAILLERSASGVDRLQMNYYADLSHGLDDGADQLSQRKIGSLLEIFSQLR